LLTPRPTIPHQRAAGRAQSLLAIVQGFVQLAQSPQTIAEHRLSARQKFAYPTRLY
jgi:hypothetical protein